MIKKIMEQIENSRYWDQRVREVECNYFGDEVKLIFGQENQKVLYHFEKCYRIRIEHDDEYEKKIPSKTLSIPQIPYFMQDVKLREIILHKNKYLEFTINMYPIELYVVCKKFKIY